MTTFPRSAVLADVTERPNASASRCKPINEAKARTMLNFHGSQAAKDKRSSKALDRRRGIAVVPLPAIREACQYAGHLACELAHVTGVLLAYGGPGSRFSRRSALQLRVFLRRAFRKGYRIFLGIYRDLVEGARR